MAKKTKRVMMGARLPDDLLREMRGAAYMVPGLTLSGFVESAARAHLATLRRKHNKGKPFKGRASTRE